MPVSAPMTLERVAERQTLLRSDVNAVTDEIVSLKVTVMVLGFFVFILLMSRR